MQRSEGALREQFSMLVDAAPELRCFGLEPWAAERILDVGMSSIIRACWKDFFHRKNPTPVKTATTPFSASALEVSTLLMFAWA